MRRLKLCLVLTDGECDDTLTVMTPRLHCSMFKTPNGTEGLLRTCITNFYSRFVPEWRLKDNKMCKNMMWTDNNEIKWDNVIWDIQGKYSMIICRNALIYQKRPTLPLKKKTKMKRNHTLMVVMLSSPVIFIEWKKSILHLSIAIASLYLSKI